MASKQSSMSFVLFALGMVLLMCGLLLVPNQLFGDDPTSPPPPAGAGGSTCSDKTNCDAGCKDIVKGDSCTSMGVITCKMTNYTPPGGTEVKCTGCKCKINPVERCECKE